MHPLDAARALVRGNDATLVSDAHTTEDLSHWGAPPPEKVIEHTNLYWGNHEALGATAGTVAAIDVYIDETGPRLVDDPLQNAVSSRRR